MAISSRAERLCKCGKKAKYLRTKFGESLCRACYNTANYRANRDERLAQQRNDYRTKPDVRERIRARSIKYNRDLWRKRREELFAFKGHRCVRCGFSDIRALQIDHINGGGVRQQREMNWHERHRWCLEHPDEWQILCANCNWIKRAERNEQPPGPPRRI